MIAAGFVGRLPDPCLLPYSLDAVCSIRQTLSRSGLELSKYSLVSPRLGKCLFSSVASDEPLVQGVGARSKRAYGMHSSCQPRRHHGPRTRASSQSPTIAPGRFWPQQKRPVSQTRPRAETIPSWLQIRLAINRLKPAGSHGPPPRRTRRSEASPAARHELFPQPRGLDFLFLPFHTLSL